MSCLVKKYKELKEKLFGKFKVGDRVILNFYSRDGQVVIKILNRRSTKFYEGIVLDCMSDRFPNLYKKGDEFWFHSDNNPEACIYVPKTQKEKTIEKIHQLEMKWKTIQKEKKK